jgi:hypothetical protein
MRLSSGLGTRSPLAPFGPLSWSRILRSYFCILNMPAVPAREIAVLPAANDREARDASEAVAWRWPGFETVEVYEGERLVGIIGNPDLGFAREALRCDPAA